MLIFITGNSRSGTTMMGRILNRHPDVFTFGELHFFGNLWEPGSGKEYLSMQESVALFSVLLARQREGFLTYRHPEKYQQEAEAALRHWPDKALKPMQIYRLFLEYETARNGKKIPCEQTPSNGYYARLLLDAFEDSFVINMVRDPRDVLLSQKKKWKRKFLGASRIPLKESIRSWFNYHPVLIAWIWKKNAVTGLQMDGHNRYRSVHFEKLVSNPETELKAICRLLQLSFHKELMQVTQAGSSSRMDNPSATGIDQNVSGQWKKGGLSKTEIWWCEKIAGKPMKQLGYALSEHHPHPLVLIWLGLLLPVKTGVSFLMNLSRMKNIRKTLARKFGTA